MNPETRFMKELERSTKALIPDLLWQRHQDRFFFGVADVELHCYLPPHQGVFSRSAWLEVKWIHLPKRTTTLVKLHGTQAGQLTPAQRVFLLDRMRFGVKGLVVYGYEASSGHKLGMICHANAIPNVLSAQELCERANLTRTGGFWDLRPSLQ